MAPLFRLVPGKEYLFIDALYLEEFRGQPDSLGRQNNLFALRHLVFPDAVNPYAIMRAEHEDFDVRGIQPLPSEEADPDNVKQFCSDTGLILLVDADCLPSVVADLDFEQVADLTEDQDVITHWPEALADYNTHLYLFATCEIHESCAGGGNFQLP